MKKKIIIPIMIVMLVGVVVAIGLNSDIIINKKDLVNEAKLIELGIDKSNHTAMEIGDDIKICLINTNKSVEDEDSEYNVYVYNLPCWEISKYKDDGVELTEEEKTVRIKEEITAKLNMISSVEIKRDNQDQGVLISSGEVSIEKQ